MRLSKMFVVERVTATQLGDAVAVDVAMMAELPLRIYDALA